MRAAWLIVWFLILAPIRLAAQVENPFIIDDNISAIVAARDLTSIHEITTAYEQARLPQRFTDESTYGTKILGRFYRLGKTIFAEDIEDFMLSLVQHEVFGHGARLREFGDEHVTYGLHVFPPYGSGSGVTYFNTDQLYSLDQYSAIDIAGMQADELLGDEMRLRAIERGRINYRESQLYFTGRLSVATYAAWTQASDLDAGNGNDIAGYVRIVGHRNPTINLSRIQSLSLLSFLDPMTLDWFYSYFYGYLIKGEVETPVPTIDAGAWRYLPGFRFGLTPFGYEFYLENMAIDSGRVINLTLSAGSADKSTSWSASVSSHHLWRTGGLTLDGHAALWRQPELQLGIENMAPTFPWTNGALGTIMASYQISSGSGLTLEAGYKSKGFVQGEPLDAGGIFRAGIQFEE